MLFNSFEFLVFAIIFFSLWPLFRKNDNLRWGWITTASLFFYGWWDWRFLFLILFSGLVDYLAGLGLRKEKLNKKAVLAISLIANLGSLFIFKYAVFIATIIQDLGATIGWQLNLEGNIPEFALILPVGISFYTFQSLSYTLDIYKGRLEPTKNILHFFSYLVMFPQLVAGPIIRAKDFLKQLASYRIPSDTEKWNAMKMICFGLFQKVVIADNLSYFIDSAFEGKANYDGSVFWWVVAIAFSFQIYADFSGYSLVARGLAKMLGYHFKMNFNHPYLSKSIREFWSRWHISLSTWFRDYVYIPLGGSKNGVYVGVIALFITMMLSGIWHGANYTFLMWALLHIFYQLTDRFLKWSKKLSRFTILLIAITFIQVTIAWVYFRAENITQGNEIIGKLVSFSSSDYSFFTAFQDNLIYLYLAIIIECVILMKKRIKSFYFNYKKHQSLVDIALVSLAIVMILLFRGEGQQFIYFQF